MSESASAQLNLTSTTGTMANLVYHYDITVTDTGTTNIGTHMTSDPFNFPVQVCNGCLVGSVSPCPYASAPANSGNSCNPAQDQVVDCCTENGELVCPPTVAAQ